MSYKVISHGYKKHSQVSPWRDGRRLPRKVIGEYNSLHKAKAACTRHAKTAWKAEQSPTFTKWAFSNRYESNAYEYRGAIFQFTIERK